MGEWIALGPVNILNRGMWRYLPVAGGGDLPLGAKWNKFNPLAFRKKGREQIMTRLDKMVPLLAAAVLCGGLVAEEATARAKRVSQVPNGSAFSCNTCHTTGGGSPLNPFGLEVMANFLTAAGAAGDVRWGPELAALDSDGDGASNGAELGDPQGTWAAGEAGSEGEDQDGEAMVFHPGDPASTPPVQVQETAVVRSAWARIKRLVGAE